MSAGSIDRWICPTCGKPIGKQGVRLAKHGGEEMCPGTGALLQILEPWLPPESWVPPTILPDRAPFRKWRALGWSPEQIAAVTGEGALW